MSYKTIDEIHSTILENISNDYVKRQGYPTYDLTRGVSFAIKEVDDLAEQTRLKQSVRYLEGDELDTIIQERIGLVRKEATNAIGYVVITGNGVVNIGDLFATATGIQFKATENKTIDGLTEVNIECVEYGDIGNVAANTIREFPVTLQGLSKVTNPERTTGGAEIESDEDYRIRYFNNLRNKSNGVNQAAYIEWAESVTGVGRARCIPIWNGKNTVKVLLVGSDFTPANSRVVQAVQTLIDPNKNGDGAGTAPIGAVTTVEAAKSIGVTITIRALNYTGDLETIKTNIFNSVDRYIKTTAFNTDKIVLSKIAQYISEVSGVNEFTEILLNNGHASITLNNDECGYLTEVKYEDIT